MRSQSLFNFFTKAAGVRTTSAGTRIHPKLVGESPSAASTSAAAQAEEDRRARMTQEQRWDEDFNNHLSDQAGAGKDQYNFAFDNYLRDLAAEVASGKMKEQDAAKARQYIIDSVRAKQRQFHTNYLASYDNGDHTDADRKGIRGTRIRTTHGDNGLVHFRYGDFGENTTFGGAERGYKQRDARLAAGEGRGGAGATAGAGGAPQMPRAQAARPNDASRAQTMMQRGSKQPPANASPITFKGGYTVAGVSGDIDWAATGDGSINVSGSKLTADQYNAFNNVRSSLTTQLRQRKGLGETEAKAKANRMANRWMADQVAAANGRVQGSQKRVENAQPVTPAQPAAPAPVTPAQPAAQTPEQPKAQPVTPAPSGTPGLTIPEPFIPDTITTPIPEFDISDLRLPEDLITTDPVTTDPVTPKTEAANLFALDGNTTANDQSGTTARPAAQVSAQSTTPAAPAPSYEQGFGHTSKEDFVNRYGENASYEDLFKHYGNHAYNNMQNLKTKLTELKRQGKTPQDPEYKRLADQYKLSQSRYTSLYHARAKMDQKGLNSIYQTDNEDNPLNWVFDEADDSAAYWKDHHASWGAPLQGTRHRETAMPKELANFNLLW